MTSLAVACLWGVLAARSPTVTYHLAPMLLAASAPLTVFFKEGRGRAVPHGAAAATGLAIALLTTAILTWQGLLAGPDLTGGDHAAIEAAASAPLGAIIGWWLARRGCKVNTNDP